MAVTEGIVAIARRFLISGRVQGVFFRESTRRVAESLSITGYAKNLSDGSVEVLACGSREAIGKLESWLQHGPPMARVERVSGENVDLACPGKFTSR